MPAKSDGSKNTWEDRWSNPDFDPWWQAKDIPDYFGNPLEKYLTDPSASIVDLGCGSGVMTCELAARYAQVCGVDVSDSAIELAKENAKKYQRAPQFLVGDVLKDTLPNAPFHGALDRGCLQVLGARQVTEYARNVHRHLTPDGVLILMHKHKSSTEDLMSHLEPNLRPYFQIEECQAIVLGADGVSQPAAIITCRACKLV